MSDPIAPYQLPPGVDNILRMAAEQFGTPCYVYLLDEINARAALIKRLFGNRFEISYAVKANPNRSLLREIASVVPSLDVSSGGELRLALECGYSSGRLTFSGPGKSIEELSLAVETGCGAVIVESMVELAELDQLARERGRIAAAIMRISPTTVPKGFGVSMARRPSQFGIDEEVLNDALSQMFRFKNVRLAGFHIYAGAQCLDGGAICENFENYIRIFSEFAERHCLAPEQLIFGGGIGIPYHLGQVPVDLASVAARMNPKLDALRELPGFERTRFHLEIGRLLVGEAGYFLTKVRRSKQSRGKEIRICDGGLNNHLAACGHFGSIIHRNYVITKCSPSSHNDQNRENMTFDVFGPLCTTIDQLARDLRLPSLEVGDVLVIHNSGAYGYSASPMGFISHPPAKEVVMLTNNGKIQLNEVSTH